MSIAKFFDRAVTGWREDYPRSRSEAGIGLSLGLLVSIVFSHIPILFWLGLACGALWTGFYLWAFVVAVRMFAREGDVNYDRRGKYKLSKEYWDTESATSAKAKKSKSKR